MERDDEATYMYVCVQHVTQIHYGKGMLAYTEKAATYVVTQQKVAHSMQS